MKEILPLLFICVTLHLANGNINSPSQEQDQYQKSESHMHNDWNAFRGNMMPQVELELKNGTTHAYRSFQKPLLEEPVLHHRRTDETEDSVEGAGFRGSSGLGVTFRHSRNVFPGFQHGISSRSKEEYDTCFPRQVIALLNLAVANGYDKAIEKHGEDARGSKILHVLVKELAENVEYVTDIEILDRALLKLGKIVRIFFRMFRKNFVEQIGDGPEITLGLAFISQIELMVQDFIEYSAEDTRAKAPTISLLLDFMDTILVDLNEEEQAPYKKYLTHVPDIQRFVDDARAVFEALTKGLYNLKETPGFKDILKDILLSIEATIKDLIEDYSLLERTPGSAGEFYRKMLKKMKKQLRDSREEYFP